MATTMKWPAIVYGRSHGQLLQAGTEEGVELKKPVTSPLPFSLNGYPPIFQSWPTSHDPIVIVVVIDLLPFDYDNRCASLH